MLIRCFLLAALAVLGAAAGAAAQNAESNARQSLQAVLPETWGLREGEKDALVGLFQAQTTTFPIGSSAGGFTWSFNPQLGVPMRRSRSFGPMFAERPLTTGRHRLSFSVGFQHTDWKELAGQRINDGIDFANWDPEDGWFEYFSTFKLSTEQTAVTAMFGVTDSIDIGVRVPYLRQRVSGTLAFYCGFCEGNPEPKSGSSAGLGDVEIRGKVAFPTRGLDLATGIDVRLPTGDEQKLLGSGSTQVTAMLIGGAQSGAMSPHFNIGYTFAGGGIQYPSEFDVEFHPSNELKYAVGAEYAVSTRLTLAGDVIGRTMFNTAKLTMFSNFAAGRSGLGMEKGHVNLLLGAASAKVMIADMWLLTGAVAFPLNSAGIKPGITPVIGFERAF
jgi:hypothetical protein